MTATNLNTDLTPEWAVALSATTKEYADYCNDVHLNVHPVQAYDIYMRTRELLSHVDAYTRARPPMESGRELWVQWFTDKRGQYSVDAAQVHVAGYILGRAHTALAAIVRDNGY